MPWLYDLSSQGLQDSARPVVQGLGCIVSRVVADGPRAGRRSSSRTIAITISEQRDSGDRIARLRSGERCMGRPHAGSVVKVSEKQFLIKKLFDTKFDLCGWVFH